MFIIPYSQTVTAENLRLLRLSKPIEIGLFLTTVIYLCIMMHFIQLVSHEWTIGM
ncbi:hypothetical protein LPE509_p00073 (plasmid) [Legionella pneumophila subsp. pneumophila LPE509]|nr:hypothetical protein LPE509_p00073 [Legionella pneumophila subsp. pneumophila LPE509]